MSFAVLTMLLGRTATSCASRASLLSLWQVVMRSRAGRVLMRWSPTSSHTFISENATTFAVGTIFVDESKCVQPQENSNPSLSRFSSQIR